MEKSVNYDRSMQLLSADQAKRFISEKLEITNCTEKFHTDKLALLNQICESWQGKVPYQTISQLSQETETRSAPSLEKNVAAMLSLTGGRCWTQTTGMHILLTALGYDARLIIAHVFSLENPIHVAVVVNDVTSKGSHHLVDVGFAHVNPTALCLDFELESEVVDGVYKPYKFIRHEGWYVRCNREVSSSLRSIPGVRHADGWTWQAYIKEDLVERTYDECYTLLTDLVYSKPDNFANMDVFMCIIPAGRYILLHNLRLKMEETPGGKVNIVTYSCADEVLAAIREHFPTLDEEMVKRALQKSKLIFREELTSW